MWHTAFLIYKAWTAFLVSQEWGAFQIGIVYVKRYLPVVGEVRLDTRNDGAGG